MKAAVRVGVALIALLAVPGHALAVDPRGSVTVTQWTAPDGHAFVGVRTSGHWAPPSTTTTTAITPFCSLWQNQGVTKPNDWFYWIWVYQGSCSSSTLVNPTQPATTFLTGTSPGIGIRPTAFGDMSLYLSVSVQPPAAPAKTQRTVSGQLTTGWLNALDGAILAYVVPSSVHVTSWSIDFGDGSATTLPPDSADPFAFSTTDAYAPGTFNVVATAHVSGQGFGAFFAPDGTPFEQLIPFSIDISNQASGVTVAPIEYVPPVVTVAASPSGTLPDGTAIPPDAAGHAALWWPRGLHCSLLVRADVVTEGFERSGGAVIGGATTKLTGYHYTAGTNDAADATASGDYAADAPIAIQWNTPLPGAGTYPITLTLDLQTTYADGTVRTSTVSGTVNVTVIYSAVNN